MNISSMEVSEDDKFILYRTTFWILIGLQIPVAVVSLFSFGFFIIHRTSLIEYS
jgi:hypothetical protein